MAQKYFSRSQTRSTIFTSHSSSNIRFIPSSKSITLPPPSQPLSKLTKLLQKKIANKKRYHFQLLKQFYLYPDSSLNSTISNPAHYFAVLTGEEKLHSLFKILETQLLETKIWAIVNLKWRKRQVRIASALPICEAVVEKKEKEIKGWVFQEIREKSVRFQNKMSHQRLVSITIANQTPKKSIRNEPNKSDYNISRQTEIDSYASERSVHNRWQNNECAFSCQQCISCCCECRCPYERSYDLQDRLEYLRYLEELARQTECE